MDQHYNSLKLQFLTVGRMFVRINRMHCCRVFLCVNPSVLFLIHFRSIAESYSNPLAPEGHEVDEHRAAAQ